MLFIIIMLDDWLVMDQSSERGKGRTRDKMDVAVWGTFNLEHIYL